MTLSQRTRRRMRVDPSSNDEGAAALEFALIASFLLVPLVLGVISLGLGLATKIQMLGAVRDAARYVSVTTGSGSSEADTRARAAVGALPASAGTDTVATSFSGGGTMCSPGKDVTVTWDREIDTWLGFLPIPLDTVTINAKAVMRCGG